MMIIEQTAAEMSSCTRCLIWWRATRRSSPGCALCRGEPIPIQMMIEYALLSPMTHLGIIALRERYGLTEGVDAWR